MRGFEGENDLGQKKENAQERVEHSYVSMETKACTAHPERNEDTAFIAEDSLGVFDGIGGYERGDVASTIASETIQEELKKLSPLSTPEDIEAGITAAFHKANPKLSAYAEEHKLSKMGTTATVVKIHTDSEGSKTAIIGHVGDSRACVVRVNGSFERITEDDTLVRKRFDPEERQEVNAILDEIDSSEELKKLDKKYQDAFHVRNVLTESLTPSRKTNPRLYRVKLNAGDRLVLTTDGIHDNLTTSQIAEKAFHTEDSKKAARALVETAYEQSINTDNMRRKPDDMTAIVWEYELEGALVEGAQNFDELFEILEGLGKIQGSSNIYTVEELRQHIARVRTGDEPIHMVTRTHKLRSKVEELLQKEKER